MATEARRGWVGGLAITRGGMREMRRSAWERCARMALLLLTLDEAMAGCCRVTLDVDRVREVVWGEVVWGEMRVDAIKERLVAAEERTTAPSRPAKVSRPSIAAKMRKERGLHEASVAE